MSEGSKSIHDFDFKLICDYFSSLERQGPGSPEVTVKALGFIDHLTDGSWIADIGCGTGGQTAVLAQHIPGRITGIDLFDNFIELFNSNAQRLNLLDRVNGVVGSMEDLPFQPGTLDLIWSEGAIYNIGFEQGLKKWRKFLKRGGYIAVSEASWFTEERPVEIDKFWKEAYPQIDTIPKKVAQMQQAGYVPIATFVLPESCWIEHFYQPQVSAQEKFLQKHKGDKSAEELVTNQRQEAELYYKYQEYYGYVFPTIYSEAEPLNMDIMNRPDLQAKAQGLMIAQAGVYSKSANLFAPYYRQTSFVALNPDEDMYKNKYFRIGADDVAAAFDYYLEHWNQGRPFILASHSQGSLVMIDLIRKKLSDPELSRKLVAAYLIGYSVMSEDFKRYPWMKPATGAGDTGVVISYNTQAPGAAGSPVLVDGAFCINPLNWETDGTPAGKELNKGAVFFDDFTGTLKKEVPQYTGARINPENGALETMPPDYDQLELGHFPQGVLHKFDYAFWYRNLQENVEQRINNYLTSAEGEGDPVGCLTAGLQTED